MKYIKKLNEVKLNSEIENLSQMFELEDHVLTYIYIDFLPMIENLIQEIENIHDIDLSEISIRISDIYFKSYDDIKSDLDDIFQNLSEILKNNDIDYE